MYSELGTGCSSTAWVAGLWSDGTLFTSLMPDHVQDEVFADPNVRITVSFPLGGTVAISDGDGGYRLSGRWPKNRRKTDCRLWQHRRSLPEYRPVKRQTAGEFNSV